jgi:antitoxin (DNA-binding transcriptional repressor) of toxin-antitoxin stability system
MSIAVPIEVAKQNIEELLEKTQLGETITLLDPGGTPLAVIVSLRPMSAVETPPVSEWVAQWAALAEEVGQAWKNEKSAVEVISEMRR